MVLYCQPPRITLCEIETALHETRSNGYTVYCQEYEIWRLDQNLLLYAQQRVQYPDSACANPTTLRCSFLA